MSIPRPTAPIEAFDKETVIKRNPHTDFATVEAQRPNYHAARTYQPTKTPNPSWQPGDGASNDDWQHRELIAIDPNDPTRTSNQNYKLMISTTLPRPIALVSTVAADGTRKNLAPFSYFNNVSNDPPLYSIAFYGVDKQSLVNLIETGELSISVVSDWFFEAANFTSVYTPPHISEWPLSGLHPAKSSIVKPAHVAEAAFSIECTLHSLQPIFSKTELNDEGTPLQTVTLALVEAVMFHVREDAIDEMKENVDIKVLRPVWNGGGIMYGSILDGWETLRPDSFGKLRETKAIKDILEKAGDQ